MGCSVGFEPEDLVGVVGKRILEGEGDGDGEATGVAFLEPEGVPLLLVVVLAVIFSVEMEMAGSAPEDVKEDIEGCLMMEWAGPLGRVGGAGPIRGSMYRSLRALLDRIVRHDDSGRIWTSLTQPISVDYPSAGRSIPCDPSLRRQPRWPALPVQ